MLCLGDREKSLPKKKQKKNKVDLHRDKHGESQTKNM